MNKQKQYTYSLHMFLDTVKWKSNFYFLFYFLKFKTAYPCGKSDICFLGDFLEQFSVRKSEFFSLALSNWKKKMMTTIWTFSVWLCCADKKFPFFSGNFIKMLQNFRIHKYREYIWKQHEKQIKMCPNKTMFGSVVLEIACGMFILQQDNFPMKSL